MYNPAPVFRFVNDALTEGHGVVLVTIAAVTGGSSRNPGAHLVVRADGRIAGSLSGGCIEAAVAAEALEVLREGVPRMSRYGAGSRFVDIRLPCGGSLDLLFTPLGDASLGAELVAALDARRPFSLALPLVGGRPWTSRADHRFGVAQTDKILVVNHVPALRLALFGHGAALPVLRELARAAGIETISHSPDPELLGDGDVLLAAPGAADGAGCDRWTAAVLLFHDHDWEPPILARLLPGESFYIGAMGSRTAHAARSDALRALGVAQADIDRIVAPIGLIPSLRDPETLAVSILAEVLQRYLAAFIDPA